MNTRTFLLLLTTLITSGTLLAPSSSVFADEGDPSGLYLDFSSQDAESTREILEGEDGEVLDAPQGMQLDVRPHRLLTRGVTEEQVLSALEDHAPYIYGCFTGFELVTYQRGGLWFVLDGAWSDGEWHVRLVRPDDTGEIGDCVLNAVREAVDRGISSREVRRALSAAADDETVAAEDGDPRAGFLLGLSGVPSGSFGQASR